MKRIRSEQHLLETLSEYLKRTRQISAASPCMAYTTTRLRKHQTQYYQYYLKSSQWLEKAGLRH